jgi:prepilin-type N-terminal cleavage/methylation domain-containing protein
MKLLCLKKLPATPRGKGEFFGLGRKSLPARASSGFTLLEVLVSLAVLSVGAALTLSLISGSLGNIRKVQLRTRTIEHAEAVMELALLDPSIQQPTTFTGDFQDGTRWAVQVQDYVPPDEPLDVSSPQQSGLRVRLLSYTVEVIAPDSSEPDYRLQTLKLVSTSLPAQTGGLP